MMNTMRNWPWHRRPTGGCGSDYTPLLAAAGGGQNWLKTKPNADASNMTMNPGVSVAVCVRIDLCPPGGRRICCKRLLQVAGFVANIKGCYFCILSWGSVLS